MGKTNVIEQERQETPEVTCQHHWIIESPRGAISKGRCKRCREERDFRNSATDHLWENDSGSGSGYSTWSGVRSTPKVADDDDVAAASGSDVHALAV